MACRAASHRSSGSFAQSACPIHSPTAPHCLQLPLPLHRYDDLDALDRPVVSPALPSRRESGSSQLLGRGVAPSGTPHNENTRLLMVGSGIRKVPRQLGSARPKSGKRGCVPWMVRDRCRVRCEPSLPPHHCTPVQLAHACVPAVCTSSIGRCGHKCSYAGSAELCIVSLVGRCGRLNVSRPACDRDNS